MSVTVEHESAPESLRTYQLGDRFQAGGQPSILTGVQAIPRLLVEQQTRDQRNGLRTASLVSGYPGSPLASLDKTIAAVPGLAREHDVRLIPGMNEELAATAVWGSQTPLPREVRTHDGVVGVWYGKGPGADRASDALRHGNLYGADPRGGVLVLVADDPGAKSSTVPCASERMLASLGFPVLFPRTSEELIAFGLYGTELSRLSGCWVAIKIVSDVADGLWSVERDFSDLEIVRPTITWKERPWMYEQRTLKIPSHSLLAEADLVGPRWAMVEAFGDANALDAVEVDSPHARLGIAAPGTAFDLTRQALRDLGLDDDALARVGIRLLRIGMPYPLSRATTTSFAAGLDEILIVEDKVSFVEAQVRDLLYASAAAPRVLGKRDSDGNLLIPADGALTADRLLQPLRRVLKDRVKLATPEPAPRPLLSISPVSRIPYFCSGCPHNRSTVVPGESLAAGGIGCHTMVTIAPREESQVTSLTQMGGEGAQWIGQAPFTDVNHIFQNVGDGTYFHSGQLALQACISAGVNITYKILYNSAVAMTGAQDAVGALDVPTLTRKLASEGVRRVIVCADDPSRYGRRAAFARGVDVWHRDRMEEAQLALRETPGVTVIIYDQQCAAEARRLRKRGALPAVTKRVVINEAVCEGCGDCGVKSNCLSVQPNETEFGRKTLIDQSSCNVDFSCLAGDCPSFVTVEIDPKVKPPRREIAEPPVAPRPQLPAIHDTFDLFLAGIGGTGIVTVNQVLATAAMQQGLTVAGLDQTGLSQKAGPVTSHLRLSRGAGEPANRLGDRAADCFLAFDLMVGSDPGSLAHSDPARTVVLASTGRTPTGAMVFDPAVAYPDEPALLAAVSGAAERVIAMDALSVAQTLFGGTEVANFLLVGAAYQAGALPLTAEAIEGAIAVNGVAVAANIKAFRWGCVAVSQPEVFAHATSHQALGGSSAEVLHLREHLLSGSPLVGETRRLAGIRAAEVNAHSNAAAARRYLRVVEAACAAECRIDDVQDFSAAVARGLHRFMAYKDEYEVARLLTDRGNEQAIAEQVPGAVRTSYNLHPPVLRAAGVGRKISLGPAWQPVMRGLARGRVLRGTPFDPFGHTSVRRVERELVIDYLALADRLVADLPNIGVKQAATVASTAELVRGYEEVKLRSVKAYRQRREELGYPLNANLVALLNG